MTVLVTVETGNMTQILGRLKWSCFEPVLEDGVSSSPSKFSCWRSRHSQTARSVEA